MRRITLKEFYEEAESKWGDIKDWLFVCPRCGTKQNYYTLEQAGLEPGVIERQLGFSCVGRHDPKQGCDWTLGGLFRIHKLEIELNDGSIRPCFELADPEPKCSKCNDTGITDGWVPTYNDPDNSGLAPPAEPCDCGAYEKLKKDKDNG